MLIINLIYAPTPTNIGQRRPSLREVHMKNPREVAVPADLQWDVGAINAAHWLIEKMYWVLRQGGDYS